MKKILTSCALAIVLLPGMIQNAMSQSGKFCGNAEIMRKMYAENPQLEKDMQIFLENNARIIKNKSEAIIDYHIPVVFHILHENGNENISDAQIYRQMEILNLDYNKLNPGLSLITPAFQPLIADCKFQFHLPTLDPEGNCTNGIVHYYNHETNNGDGLSKIDQWDRKKYLNVWVVAKIGGTAAGYALQPPTVAGSLFKYDDIMILHDYISDNGTGSGGRDQALTHEIGHYLGLAHPWGNTNDPGEACGDDGVEDTPVTKGFSSIPCPPADLQINTAICNPPNNTVIPAIIGIEENFQNFMDYSYCQQEMYTIGQAEFMTATLNSGTAFRNNLWTATNLSETGALAYSTPYNDANIGAHCSPLPAFCAKNQKDAVMENVYVKKGNVMQFFNQTHRAKATGINWTFETGTPGTSTAEDPSITFSTSGWHSVALTSTNAQGGNTITKAQNVLVTNDWAEFSGSHTEKFDGETANWWIADNPEQNDVKWTVVNNVGYDDNYCIMLKNYSDPQDRNLGSNTDNLVSPVFDLRYLKNPTFSFRYSCASRASILAEITERLTAYYSVDGGATWTGMSSSITPTFMNYTKGALANAGSFGYNYTPSNTTQWVSVSSAVLKNQPNWSDVRFRIEYYASDVSNNIYIDDIAVNGLNTSTGEISANYYSFNVFPNPTNSSNPFTISYFNMTDEMHVSVTDVLGNKVFETVSHQYGSNTITIDSEKVKLAPGMYFVTIRDDDHSQSKKILIQ